VFTNRPAPRGKSRWRSGHGITNTINRAELAPILYALKHGVGDTIATDSAASLYQIARYIRDPGSMQWHLHHPLLRDIAQEIVARCNAGKPVHLMKVSAHCGIVGNEAADELAKAAGQPSDSEAASVEVCHASHLPPMHSLYWPMHESPEHGLTHVPNLKRHLKQQLHPTLRLGYSNQDGQYFTAWQETVPIAHAASSNAFLTCPPGVDAGTRKEVLQARYGTLNTAKFRYRCGLAPTDACLLCGVPDGGHHSLSGCKHMLGMYTRRHNEAGGIIYRTLAKGGLGASLVMQDIGRHNAAGEGMDADTVEAIGTRLPDEIAAACGGAGALSRPDILIAHNKTPGLAQIHVVEIKYCQDTKRRGQHQAALEQHAELIRRLRKAYGHQVHLHVITLGVTGTIYTDLFEALEAMQVSKLEAKRCAAKLHLNAVTYVTRIMHTKWQQESASQHGAAGGKP
jgi:ribonuclease HI